MIVYNTRPVVQNATQYVVPGQLSPASAQLISIESDATIILATESGVFLETE